MKLLRINTAVENEYEIYRHVCKNPDYELYINVDSIINISKQSSKYYGVYYTITVSIIVLNGYIIKQKYYISKLRPVSNCNCNKSMCNNCQELELNDEFDIIQDFIANNTITNEK